MTTTATDDYIRRAAFEKRAARIDAADSSSALRSVLAMREARTSIAGPLKSIAVLIKDNIECEGLPGTAGSLALSESPARRTAPLVAALESAGCDIVGSANLSEWANLRSSESISGWSAVGGLTTNAWKAGHSAGGSSSGSGVAVAAGLVSLAIGTETDGSIVCPAALNGVVGLKPTVGSISTVGIVPLSASQDTPGPIAIDVSLAAKAFAAMSGRGDIADKVSNAAAVASRLRVGVAENWVTGHEPTDAIFESVIGKVSALVHSVKTSRIKACTETVHEDELTVLLCELKDDMAAYLAGRFPQGHRVMTLAEIIDFNHENAAEELALFNQDLFELSVATNGRNDAKYTSARKRGLDWSRARQFGPAFESFDVLIAPTYGPAWQSGPNEGDGHIGGAVTSPAAIAGTPLLTIPMGLVDGLPVGVTLAGPADSEAELLSLGRGLEALLGCRPQDGFVPPLPKTE